MSVRHKIGLKLAKKCRRTWYKIGMSDKKIKNTGKVVNNADPRRVRTREAIIRAGRDLFSRHNADGVSMSELCNHAGVSKQSFYNHFNDKDALAHEILRIARQELDELVREAVSDEPDSARRIALGLCVVARQAITSPEQARLLARLPLSDSAAGTNADDPLVNDLRAGLASGRLAILTIDSALAFVIGVGRALITRVLLNSNVEHATTTTQHFITLVLRAFAVPPAETELIAAQTADWIVRTVK